MLNGVPYKASRYLSPNTAHNVQLNNPANSSFSGYLPGEKHPVFQYPVHEDLCFKQRLNSTLAHPIKDVKGREQDDSLTNMEWLPDVSIPFMQQIRCRVTHEDMKKMPRKRNRNLTGSSGGKASSTTYRKPDYSYAMLIYKAINDTEEKRMQLFQIYEWIENHFLYYKHTPGTHWKSSIRHNLSLHKIFVKEAPPPSLKSKGSFWALDRRMTEEDLLLSLQPKRPRLTRISGGESTCINRYATSRSQICQSVVRNPYKPHQSTRPPSFQPTWNTGNKTNQQVPYNRNMNPVMKPQTINQNRESNKFPGPQRNRPNILSKVVRRDSKDASSTTSPIGSSLMNLNQLFHTGNTENISPGSHQSYESGYSSLNDSSQDSPRPRSFISSTPVKTGAWISPEFGLKSSVPFPLCDDQELPSLSHFMDTAGVTQLNPCVKDEPKASSLKQLWPPINHDNMYPASPPYHQKLEPITSSTPDVAGGSQRISSEQYIPYDFGQPSSSCIIKQERHELTQPSTIIIEPATQPPTIIIEPATIIIEPATQPPTIIIEPAIQPATRPPLDDKLLDIADLINQFITEGEGCVLNGSVSTTPLRQYLTEEESSLSLDLESPKRAKKKTLTRRSLDEELN